MVSMTCPASEVAKASKTAVAVISGSPSSNSRTGKLADTVVRRLVGQGVAARHIAVRDLDPVALLSGDLTNPMIAEAVDLVGGASGIVLVTPTFKASFSGLLKAFIDILPQFGLKGKVVMPLAVGGTLSHVLFLDYALRPVLQSMMPAHVIRSQFMLDQWLTQTDDAGLIVSPEGETPLLANIEEFLAMLLPQKALAEAR